MTFLNLICRDSYDKEVKNAKELQRKVAAPPRRPRRPDIAVYNPRRRGTHTTLFVGSFEFISNNVILLTRHMWISR